MGGGLGLYIVKTILDQHQAEYSIINTEGGVFIYNSIHKHGICGKTAPCFLTI